MSKTIYAAESWDKIYDVFEVVNFNSYDYDTVKESLIQYMKTYYPENFNDFIESSELISIIEMFAVIAEQLAYRIDMAAHENTIDNAERKQSILRLARYISYNATRNVPARGLVKLTSIKTSERIIDSQGVNLANRLIVWNDLTNPFWKEQFFLVINRVITKQIGQPKKAFQVDDVDFQLYELGNSASSFHNATFSYAVTTNTETFPMEIVSTDLDDQGAFERSPDGTNKMFVLYANDGAGDSSDLTGFLLYTKQGELSKSPVYFGTPIPNRVVDVNIVNTNDVDVWLNEVDAVGTLIRRWFKVDNTDFQNIQFAKKFDGAEKRKRYELSSLENDRIRFTFGDGDFADIPLGNFEIWSRSSANRNIVIHKSKINNVPMNFTYTGVSQIQETCTFNFSLVGTLQNAATSEDIEHIRRNAPLTYYSQSRMVNGQDYNTYPLKDSSILKLHAVNRTFAGQPKFIEFNDASGNYQNIKLFGDDLRIVYDFQKESFTTSSSGRVLLDQVLEPLLEQSGLKNMINHITTLDPDLEGVRSFPRHTFSEKLNFQEKTDIQTIIDRHFYGEPDDYLEIPDDGRYAIVDSDFDYKIYQPNIKRVYTDDTDQLIYMDGRYVNNDPSEGNGIPSGTNEVRFGLKFLRTVAIQGDGLLTGFTVTLLDYTEPEIFTIECVNEDGADSTFSIFGSISGDLGLAEVDVLYNSNGISFTITTGGTDFVMGDAFIIDYDAIDSTPTHDSLNMSGEWQIIHQDDVPINTDYPFQLDPILDILISDPDYNRDPSWLIIVERVDDVYGNPVSWNIIFRSLKIIAESKTTKFWYNNNDVIVDLETKKQVRDKISVLKSNLNKEYTLAIGTNQVYDVIGPVIRDDGSVDIHALEVFPVGNIDADNYQNSNLNSILQFVEFVNTIDDNPLTASIDTRDYVYYEKDADDLVEILEPVPQSVIDSFTPDTFVSDPYSRKIGRPELDFLWQHFSPNTNLIDPSTTNINDMFVITRGYYDNVKEYVNGISPFVPVPPSSLELRTTYRNIINTKMLSDTVVMHSGKIKLLFGSLADPQLRAKFRVIKSLNSLLTDDEIKGIIKDEIDSYFDIENWNFGDTFYVTELISVIHTRLTSDISSVVLVPTFVNNQFGDLFIIESGEDEILQTSARVDDIEIVTTFTKTILRQ